MLEKAEVDGGLGFIIGPAVQTSLKASAFFSNENPTSVKALSRSSEVWKGGIEKEGALTPSSFGSDYSAKASATISEAVSKSTPASIRESKEAFFS